jgi:predicted DNA repair protein MutK
MAASLLALIDDIATILDDVSLLAQVAARKTAGVLGDDLALNAQQVAGVQAERELPVVWAVAKGSFVNKAILVPTALAISAWAPWAVTPLLMVGGAYLCFEGFEKLYHRLTHPAPVDALAASAELIDPAVDLMALERDKIRGAIRTDFVLSAEIIAITLGTVADAPFLSQLTVLAGIAVVMTAGVYGLVAAIVKLDDAGLYLAQRPGSAAWPAAQRRLGTVLLQAAPWLMKALSVAGTAAMFLVGGGILSHGIAPLHHALQNLAEAQGGLAGIVLPWVFDSLIGVVAGALVLAAVSIGQSLRRKPSET